MIAALFAVALAVVAVAASPLQRRDLSDWTGCMADGSFSNIMNVQNITLSPQALVRGQTATIFLSGTATGLLNQGATAQVDVLVAGFSMKTLTMPMCATAQDPTGLACPVAAGTAINANKTLTVPTGGVALDTATLQITIFNAGSTDPVGCGTTTISVV
ncbi:hypothetical protein RI367_005527 [Sorochytrium milnesiophthora]